MNIKDNIPLLTVKNLVVNFETQNSNTKKIIQAVRGVSFVVNQGEILGIVGESGSGKTVTTSCIANLLPANAATSGSIFFGNTDLLELAHKTKLNSKSQQKNAKEMLRSFCGQRIGMIFQEPGRSFDPLQNMFSVFYETFKNKNKNITKKEALEKAIALLKETGIDNAEERLQNFPHQFSGGQLQRIGIALALAQDCNLLIADEPTTALDVTIQKQIIELLLDLRKKRNLSIIFISHNINLVAQISDRIIVMYGGLIMENGNAKELALVPKHPYTKALLSLSPSFGSHYTEKRLIPIPGKVTDPSSPEKGCPFYPRCNAHTQDFSCVNTLPQLCLVSTGLTDSAQRFVRCVLYKEKTEE